MGDLQAAGHASEPRLPLPQAIAAHAASLVSFKPRHASSDRGSAAPCCHGQRWGCKSNDEVPQERTRDSELCASTYIASPWIARRAALQATSRARLLHKSRASRRELARAVYGTCPPLHSAAVPRWEPWPVAPARRSAPPTPRLDAADAERRATCAVPVAQAHHIASRAAARRRQLQLIKRGAPNDIGRALPMRESLRPEPQQASRSRTVTVPQVGGSSCVACAPGTTQ
jgi:hypothetical protein